MSDSDYDTWAERHAVIFGWRSPDDARRFLEWQKAFRRRGYSIEELHAATDAIADREVKLRWKDDHLAAIHAEIKSLRDKQKKKPPVKEPEPEEPPEKKAGAIQKLRDAIRRWGGKKK